MASSSSSSSSDDLDFGGVGARASARTRIGARDYPALCATNPDAPFTQSEKAYLLPKDEAWKARIDQWLGDMEASGEKEEIFAKWVK